MAQQRQRLDHFLVAQGMCDDPQKAWALILAGHIQVNGETIRSAGYPLLPTAVVTIKDQKTFASRGGLKLKGALDAFGVTPDGLACMDIGASHGGFTDCLLNHGARVVYAVDVGYGQLDWKLRQDQRVCVMERVNARHLTREMIADPIDLAVVDVSFLSATAIISILPDLFGTGNGEALVLVKPQFEALREEVGPGGVVSDPSVRERAVDRVITFAAGKKFTWQGTAPSPIPGAKGNREFFIHLRFCPESS